MSEKGKEIKTIELFAGVGGFRLGLQQASKKFKIVWSNQWEPSTKSQDASMIYVRRFGENHHVTQDIATIPTNEIPDHDLLVGGFPCQDYSVATTLNLAAGLEGKKGVLWWQIHRILTEKEYKPKYLFLENVDRLLKSPANQRGRDFAIILASLSDLGYIVEWRVINAADYGMPQRRRRTFFLGYHKTSPLYKEIKKEQKPLEWIIDKGILASAFNVSIGAGEKLQQFELDGDLATLTKNFNKVNKQNVFQNSGLMIDREVYTIHSEPKYEGEIKTLGDIILLNGAVPEDYYIDPDTVEKWLYLKGSKNEIRTNKASGIEYQYSEGAMTFPDSLDKPSRTIITAEGGPSPSRFKHVIKSPSNNKFRRLTPIELERLNMFPDNHTEGVSDTKRAFFMGNALV
jgi:DNA (cytosine-5)-methyltransferase 1